MALSRAVWIDESAEDLRIREDLKREVARLRRRVYELESDRIAQNENQNKLRAVFEAVRDPIFLKDLDFRYILVNPEMELLFGLPAGRIIGKTHGELFGTAADSMDRIDRRVINGEVVDQEYIRPNSDRHQVYHVVKVPIYDRAGRITGLCGVARNITRRSKLENQIEQSRRLESVSALAGGVAHEFNNALMVVSGKIELLQMTYPGDARMDQHIDALKRSTRRMVDLTAQLLAYARGGKCEPKKISWRRFVAETIAAMGMAIDPGIALDVDLKDDHARIEADQTQMKMVITAMLSNAAEAVQGEGRIKIRCGLQRISSCGKDHRDAPAGAYAWLAVEDDGVGMAPEVQNRIFEPFFTTKYHGRGLGMAAVYGIVKNHNGWITVDSKPGRGTRILIGLPAV